MYFLISVLEYRFGIFFQGVPKEIKEKELDFEPILLSPSEAGDFKIELPRRKNDDKYYVFLALKALSEYFFNVRGLPLEEIDICHSVSNYKLKNNGKIATNSPKCKQKITKGGLEIKGVYLEYLSCGELLAFPTENTELFLDENLSALAVKEHFASTALAFSENDSEIRLKKWGKASMLECVLVLYSLLIKERGKKELLMLDFVFNSGQKITVKSIEGEKLELDFESTAHGFFEYR